MRFSFLHSASVLVLVFATSSAAFAQSMDVAIKHAVETNPTIGVVANNREAVKEELRQAYGLYLPQLDTNAAIGPESTDNDNARNATGRTRTDASLNLQQRVFTGFETKYQVERQKARVESAAHRVYENAEVTALDAIGAYLEVIRQRELFALSKQNVDFHTEILGKLEQRAAGGVGTQADVAQTRARVSRAQATLAQAANDLADAESLYTRVVGQFPGELSRPDFPSAALPQTLETAVDLSTKNNPTVKVSESDVNVADADIGVAEAAFYPKLNIEGASSYRNDVSGDTGHEFDNNILLRARMNIFRGGIDRATRQETVFRMHQARSEREKSVVNANEETRRGWFAYQASAQRVGQLESAVTDLKTTRDAYEQQFNVGQRSLLDLLDAENELFTARGQLISSDLNQLRAGYRLLASTGTLLKTVNVAAPAQSNPATESFGQAMTSN